MDSLQQNYVISYTDIQWPQSRMKKPHCVIIVLLCAYYPVPYWCDIKVFFQVLKSMNTTEETMNARYLKSHQS